MAADHLGAFVRRAVESIWNRGELGVADTLFAPCYVNHGGLIPDLLRGPEAAKFSATLFRAAYPQFEVTVDTIDVLTAHGESVAIRWTARAAPASTGAKGALTGMTFGRMAGGKIVESWTSWDAPRRSARTISRAGGMT